MKGASALPPPPLDSTEVRAFPALIGGGTGAFGSDVGRESGREARLEDEVVLLFEAHHNRLLAYVRAFGLDGHDAEEIIQEVFLALFSHLQQGRSRSNLRGWVFRVAHNLALKQRQANRRTLDRHVEEAEATVAHRDPSPNPEEHAVSAQRQRRLSSVVDALPEQDRWCLHLRAEGLRYREISRALGMSLGSVSISLTRSLARLVRADEL